MNKLIVTAIVLFLLLISFYLSFHRLFFPADVLNNIPSFSENGWERPQNSLLADPVFQFEPWRDYAKTEIRSGRFPLWNNLNSNGVPFFANFQSAVLYPLNFIYYIFPQSLALLLIPLLKIVIMYSGTFLYLRELRLSKGVSIVGAIAGTFAAFPITWVLWPHTNVYILMPFVLFITENIRNTKVTQLRWFTLLSIAYCLMIFGGHPETLLHVTVVHVLYIIFRYWKNFQLYLKFFLSITFGFLLGAVQILPFLEYLTNSYVLAHRSSVLSDFFLPFKSLILNIFPFIYGSPQGEIYKPISPNTNFQEATGGYLGVVMLAGAIYGAFKQKNYYTRFWGSIIIISLLVSYKIWPLFMIAQLPILRLSANHRMIAFIGFGLAILFSFFIQYIINRKNKSKISANIQQSLLVISLILVVVIYVVSFIWGTENWKINSYIHTIRTPVFLTLFSTIVFIWSLRLKNNYIFLILAALTVLFQSLFIFANYNPSVSESDFYPETKLTKILKSLPNGNYIEVGNPALPANVNIKYGLNNIQNYDAIEIKSFKEKFNQNFKILNSWGNPEDITAKNLQILNVTYIISDFNINLKRKKIQNSDKLLLPEILKGTNLSIKFEGSNNVLRQIRIKTATFNRNNSCIVNLEITGRSGSSVYQSKINCIEFRNNVFYTVNISGLTLKKSEIYTIKLSSNGKEGNAVSVYGNMLNEPFIELFFAKQEKDNFMLVGKTKYNYVYKLDIPPATNSESIDLISETPQKRIYDVELNNKTTISFPMTYYPGWTATINGYPAKIYNEQGNMSITLLRGKSLIVFSYVPLSFALGLTISITSSVFILIFFLKSEKSIITFLLKRKRQMSKKIKRVSWGENIIISTVSLSISILIVIMSAVLFPVTFSNYSETTISWYAEHNLSKSGEYFYFYVGFLSVSLITVLFWILYIWRKK